MPLEARFDRLETTMNLQAHDALAIHASALIIDTHADTPQRFLDERWHFTDALGRGMINLTTARQGNLAAEFFAIWVDPGEYGPGTHAQRALDLTHATLDQVRQHPAELRLCLSADDILAARAEGRFAVLLGLEGGHAIENSLDRLREFHYLGIRYMTLTWSNSNDWAGSSGDPDAEPKGLTNFGRQVIREMNRLGMMIDISHVSDQTFWQVVDLSDAPVIASHSSARALTPSPRNLTDNQLLAIARKGGVCMVNFFPAFIDDSWRQAWEASRDERRDLHEQAAAPFRAAGEPVPFPISDAIDRTFTQRIGPPPFDSLIDHFDHIIRVAGIDHVGLGSDFDGIPQLPATLHSAADLPRITEALHQRGYSKDDLHKLLGGNLLRVFREIQTRS
jgi:membrane dipeptidase